ncbi:MAG: hypothetical protein JW913_02960 [Chitinispirillaceae bacterium]|nr:hypothetical protein [Chitinispirillaceae bacterium]
MRHVLGYFLVLFTSAIMVLGSGMEAQAQEHVTKIKASDLVANGESFFELSNITSELTRLARADGFIGSNESFRQIAKAGYSISQILNLYKNCSPKPVYLVSDGAGIDLMSSSNVQSLGNTLKQYLEEMKKGGTKKLLWMTYPDPQGGQWATLKKNQDLWAEAVPPIINGCTDPKTLLVDLRPVWAGHYSQYTSDGIHCTNAGGTATAEAFWKAMKDSNFFDLPVFAQPLAIARTASSMLIGQFVGNGRVSVSLSLRQPSNVTLQITTISGRSVFTAERQLSIPGLQTVEFPLGAIAQGMYCCEVRAGQLTNQSTVLVP